MQHENPSFSTCLHTWFIYYHNFNLAFISFAWKGFHKCSPKGIECHQRMHNHTMRRQKIQQNFCFIQNFNIMRFLKQLNEEWTIIFTSFMAIPTSKIIFIRTWCIIHQKNIPFLNVVESFNDNNQIYFSII